MSHSLPSNVSCLSAWGPSSSTSARLFAVVLTLLFLYAIPVLAQQDPTNLTNVNGTLFFSATTAEQGRELWKSDGSLAGTVLVKDIAPATASSNPGNLVKVGNMLYFTVNGNQLWKSDGTAQGTVLVKSSTYLATDPQPIDVNGTLYFVVNKGSNVYELWKSNGTEAGTVALKSYTSENNVPGIASLVNGDGILYFSAYEANTGMELWKSNGTAAGTVLVKDIYPGSNSSNPSSITFWNGNLYFAATDGSVLGNELWKSDGTAEGTALLKDIAPGYQLYTDYLPGNSNPAGFTVYKGALYFAAYSIFDPFHYFHDRALWRTDGTAQGTVKIGGNHHVLLTAVGETLFMGSFTDNPLVINIPNVLWKSDGTTAGTVVVKDFGWVNRLTQLVNLNGKLFFNVNGQYIDQELWTSDGTEAGTRVVKNIFPDEDNVYPFSFNSSSPLELTPINTTLFFSAFDGTSSSRHLWKSDGTEAGTVKLYTPVPGICTATGTILREYWAGVPGTSISGIPLNTTPTSTSQLTSFEAPTNVGDNYGQRIRGFICAPATGQYQFAIASDDDSELWLSTDDNPANKKKIASVSGWTHPREWNKYPSQFSAIINLEEGKKYYIEALHKEGAGGDNLAVAWSTPGFNLAVISADFISPFVPSVPVCSASGTILREYWANVPGRSVSAVPVNAAPTSTSQLTSFEAPTNVADHYAQRIRGYICAPSTGSYTFYIASDNESELWLSTDDSPAKKQRIAHVTDGGFAWTNPREWGKYSGQKSASIVLEQGKKYYIEALHKEYMNGDNLAVAWQTPTSSAITVVPGAVLSPFVPATPICTASGTILREYWSNVLGRAVSAVPVNTTPSSTSLLTSFEAPTNVADNYAQRLRGYICAPASGSYTFYIAADNEAELWLSTSDNPASKQKIAYVTEAGFGWTNPREWGKYSGQKSATITLEQGKKYYVEALHKEHMNGDNLAVAWQTPANTAITVIPGSVLSPFVPASAARMASAEEKLELKLNIYPNPSAGDKLQLEVVGMEGKQPLKLSIYNSIGTLVFSQAYESDEAGTLAKELNLAGKLTSGIYILKAESKGKAIVQKVVIQK